jgi:hypothetical protein
MMLISIEGVGVMSTLEALHIPQAGFEESADKVSEAIMQISLCHTATPQTMRTYKAMKAKASSVFFMLHLFTNAGERSAQLPYS